MKNSLILCLFYFVLSHANAQKVNQVIDLKPDKEYENILLKPLMGDSLSSSFVIWIKDTVAEHHHAFHSEHVYVLEGEADFYLNTEIRKIKPGDLIFIPVGTWHAIKVTSEIPMKVISIQSPGFDGTDRVLRK